MSTEVAAPPAVESPSRTAAAALGAMAAALIAVTYWTTLHWLAGRWWTDPFYSHGPLVPIVSGALLWFQRGRLILDPAVRPSGLVLLAAAGVLHLLGVRLMFEFLSGVAILLTLAGGVMLAGGRALLRAWAFPLFYLLFALPLPMLVLERVSLPLQFLSSACAEMVFRGLGCPVMRRGVLLVFESFTLAIADACSGLRSLITVLAISTLAARLTATTLPRKLLLVGLGMVTAVAANVLRIVVAGLVGIVIDGHTAAVFFERYSGFLFFALVLLALLGLSALLGGRKAAPDAEPVAPLPWPRPAALAMKALLPLVLVLAPAGAAGFALRLSRVTVAPATLADWTPALAGWQAVEVRSLPAAPGEERVTGTAQSADGRRVAFTVLHSVSGRYLHSPEACSLATGWIAERQEAQELRIEGGTLPVHLWVLRRGSERVCLVFWFALDGYPTEGSLDQHLGAMKQRLLRGRIDSAYGEASIALPVGQEPPAAMLYELARVLHVDVRRRLWP